MKNLRKSFPSNVSVKKTNIAIYFLLVTIIILRFTGVPDQYATIFNFYHNPGAFPFDLYMNNSFFFEASPFFAINNVLNFDQNDVAGLIGHTIAGLVGAYFLYRLLHDNFKVSDLTSVLTVILYLAFLGRDIPINTWGGFIPMQSGTATMFVKPMGIAVLYCLANQKIWWGSFLITLVIALHVLGDFILFPIFIFYIMLKSGRNFREYAVLLPPTLYLAFKASQTNYSLVSYEGAEELYALVMRYGRQDADFLYQGVPALAFLIVSFFLFPFLAQKFFQHDRGLKNMLMSVFSVTLLLFIFMVSYTVFLEEFLKIKALMMLGPVRALNYYTLVFHLVAFVSIIRMKRCNGIQKSCFLAALILLHAESVNGILYPGILLAAGLIPFYFFKEKSSLFFNKPSLSSTSILFALILVITQLYRGGVYNDTFSKLGWQYLNRWTVGIDATPDTWHSFKLLKNDKEDFPMLPVYFDSTGKLKIDKYLNIVSQKSHFIEIAHHFYFDLKALKEHKVRAKIVDEILELLNNRSPFSRQLVTELKKRGVGIMLPTKIAGNQTMFKTKEEKGSYTLLKY